MDVREWVRTGLTGCCILAALVVLGGWALNIGAVLSVLPGLTTMKANTALGFLGAGAALAIIPSHRARQVRRAVTSASLGAAVAIIGALTLAEYATGISLGLDELMVRDPGTALPPFPGRMAPGTAFGFISAGASILLLTAASRLRGVQAHRSAHAAHVLAAVPASVGYLSLTGYVYDVQGLYSFSPFASVALHTALLFIMLALAIVLTTPRLGWAHSFESRPVARRVFLRLLPVALLLPFAAGAAVVWGARSRLYDPLYAPALFALAAAAAMLALAWEAARAIRRAEGRLHETATALRQSEAQFRTISDAMPQMVWSTRPDGHDDYYNKRWYALTGTAPGQAGGEGRKAALHPDDREQAWTSWERSLQTGQPYETEYRVRMGDGAYRWFLGRALPLHDAHGVITRWFGTCTDIEDTVVARDAQARSHLDLERLVAERTRDLQETQTRLAHVQRMEALGQLAGGIAHDFNNVLQAVQSGAALLERRTGDPEGVRRLSRMIFEAAGRGNAITQRLLAFSRRGDLRADAVNAAQLLADIRDILSHTLGVRVQVLVSAPANLPALLSDQSQLETVLINLATNARDAMPGGGVLTFSAAAETVTPATAGSYPVTLAPGGYVRLCVSDTGAGMDAATLARACEPFYTTKPVGEGTGLGLAMARGFTQQSGGALQIESAPGRGTTVTLWFPVATDATQQPQAAPERPAAPQQVLARLLLVDDEGMVRDILSEELEACGYAVMTASSGEAAMAVQAAGERIDLLITDLSMPGMDGLALINQMQARQPGLPAILLTGFATNAAEIAVAGALSGTLSLLRKPVKGKLLEERVAALLAATAHDAVG